MKDWTVLSDMNQPLKILSFYTSLKAFTLKFNTFDVFPEPLG